MGKAAKLKQARKNISISSHKAGQYPSGSGKMSEVLIELAEPYRKDTQSYEEYKMLISIAAAAWNLAIIKKKIGLVAYEEALNELSKTATIDYLDLLNALMVRKEAVFPNDLRILANQQVINTGNEYQVLAASLKPADT
jgi:hypothetical protein